MNKKLRSPINLAASLLLFASTASAQTITDLPRISTTEVLKAGIYPRELTSLNNQVYFTAQDESASSEWNRRYLWASSGSIAGTSMVASTADVRIRPGVIPAANYWETRYTRPGEEMVALGNKLLLSTFDGVALFNTTDSSFSAKRVQGPAEWESVQLPLSAPDRLNLFKAGNTAYTIAKGELFGISAEPFSVSQLTNTRSRMSANAETSPFVSAFAPAGSSIIYAVTQWNGAPNTRYSMLYSLNGNSHNRLSTLEIRSPLSFGIGVPKFTISGMPEVVDVSEASASPVQPGAYIGRFNGTGTSLVNLNFTPPLRSHEEVIYGPESFMSSDSPFLHVLTRELMGRTRLYRGTVRSNNSIAWTEVWAGVEAPGQFGIISMVKAFQGNVFLRYNMGQTIVVRADGSWRYVDAQDPDYQFVKLVLETTERVKVGKMWFFSSADGRDLGVAKEATSAKPMAWIPRPKAKLAIPAQTPSAIPQP